MLVLLGGLLVSESNGQTSASEFSFDPSLLVRQWTANDGLPVSGVNSIHQDDQGFLWMATLGGIVRFDGSQFKVFSSGSNPELPNNRFVLLKALGDKRFLVTTESADILLFDKQSFLNLNTAYEFEEFYGFEMADSVRARLYTEKGILELDDSGNAAFASSTVDRVYGGVLTSDGIKWLGGPNGITRVDPDRTSEVFTTKDGLPSNDIRALVPDGSAVFVASPSGAFRFNGGIVTSFRFGDNPGQQVVASFVIRHGNAILFSTQRGWWRLQDEVLVPAFEDVGPITVNIAALLSAPVPVVDNAGNLWHAIGSRSFRNGRQVFSSSGNIVSLIPDQRGGIWLGHNRLGIFLLRPSFVHTVGIPEGMPGENAYGVIEDDAAMWVGLLDQRLFVQFRDAGVSATLMFGEPWAAARDHQGRVWLGGDRLCLVVAGSCEEQTIPSRTSPVRAIYEDSSRNLWVGSQSGLWVRRPGTDAWEYIETENGSRPWIRYITETVDGTLLFGTFGQGIAFFDDGVLTYWNADGGLPSNNIRSILPLSPEEWWIGTEDVGLVLARLNPNQPPSSAELLVIGSSHGLPDNSVHAMVKDVAGFVWINSNQGIYRLDPNEVSRLSGKQEMEIPLLLIDDTMGMRDREGNGGFQSAGFLDRDGRVRFPTQRGIAIIDPSAAPNALPRRPILTSIRSGTRSIDVSQPLVDLEPEERSLDVEFSSPQFVSPGRIQYRYRVNGMVDDWQMTEGGGHVFVNNIPAGSRTLEIQAGISGYWAPEAIRIPIRRSPTFSESIWFIVVLVGFGVSSTTLIFYGRIRLVRRRNEQLEQVIVERTKTIQEQASRLAELDDLKSQFFSNISHELRTPLTLIKGPVSKLLQDRIDQPVDKVTKQLDVIDRNVNRLNTLVNEILDLTALEAGQFELNLQVGDLKMFVDRIMSLFEQAAHDKEVTLSLAGPDEEVLWVFDPHRLEHVLVNLVGNALKFTQSGGSVHVAWRLESSAIHIDISDTGIGIAAKDLPHLFERFFRGDNSEKTKGSGIGLSLSRELIEQHGGSLSVQSVLGEGSVFSVVLPDMQQDKAALSEPSADLLSVDQRVYARQAADLVVDHQPERATILVAEDNPDLLRFLVDSLIDRFNIQTASNGKEALDLCLDTVPDLLLTDVMMPVMNGMELCAAVKESLPTSHIPVIILTAKGDIESKMAGLSKGADVYLGKPFETRELIAYIDSLLANRQRIQQSFVSRQGTASGDSALDGIAKNPPALTGMDREFLISVVHTIEEMMADSLLSVELLADHAHLSSRQFHRKIEALTGKTPGELIRSTRLDAAASMITRGEASLKEIGFAVGFGSESGFRKAFKDHFGVAPSKWKTSVNSDS